MNHLIQSLDETVAAIKADCESQIAAMKDRLTAAEIEAALCRDLLTKANTDRDMYMRVAERLVTQFGTVEKVFADAKAMALTLPPMAEPPKDHPLLPKVDAIEETNA